MDNGTTKGDHYKTCWGKFTVTKSNALSSDWLPYQAMVSKYGKAELSALVQSGAIATMKNPKDNKFWLFKDEIIQEKIESKHEKGVSGEKQTNIDATDFLKWARQDMSDVSGQDMFGWDQGALKDVPVDNDGANNNDIPKHLQSILGIKNPNSSAQQKKRFEKDVDAMTNVPDEINQEKMTARLNKVKALADQVVEEWREAKQGDKKAKTDVDFKHVQMLRSKLDEFLWEDDLNSKKGSLKKVLKDMAAHLKELKTKMAPVEDGEPED